MNYACDVKHIGSCALFSNKAQRNKNLDIWSD